MGSIRAALLMLVLLFAGAVQASAQQARVVGTDELNAAVVDRADATAQQRAQVRSLLERPEIQAVAANGGIDMERVQDAAATMSGADLDLAMPLVQAITANMAGGQVLTVTTTTLIIILLIIILLVVT
jgi:PBP1b-binding outer membrane lipoprotein LpoB